ncbi:MAG: methylenetetrahydrofolate reductase C-terminal domain-containing protein [Endomicrobium sp.]|jgi:hypothetical protein|nr:methylenetetrahydrofolate reductase C-terminal domain-containing protein [Endomicrobium sp.]
MNITEKKLNGEILKETYSQKSEGCAKGFVNGPCGGFFDGKCEINKTKNCVWILVYERLKNSGKLEEFIDKYVEPKK